MVFLNRAVVMCCLIGMSIIGFTVYQSIPGGTVKKSILTVVCTTTMIADAVRCIAGDNVEIVCLMRPGVDPHSYRPSLSHVKALVEADLVFYHGLHLEGKMGDVFMHLKGDGISSYAVTDLIDKHLLMIDDNTQIPDPHVWHAVPLWIMVVRYIAQILQHHDPVHAYEYQVRLAAYEKDLVILDEKVRAMIASIPVERRVLITAHDAFAYFGRSYGIAVLGLQGINTDTEISMYDVYRIVDTIVQYNVPAIFLEAWVPTRNIHAIQEAVAARGMHMMIGGELYSDSLGDALSGGSTYSDMIYHNVTTICKALL